MYIRKNIILNNHKQGLLDSDFNIKIKENLYSKNRYLYIKGGDSSYKVPARNQKYPYQLITGINLTDYKTSLDNHYIKYNYSETFKPEDHQFDIDVSEDYIDLDELVKYSNAVSDAIYTYLKMWIKTGFIKEEQMLRELISPTSMEFKNINTIQNLKYGISFEIQGNARNNTTIIYHNDTTVDKEDAVAFTTDYNFFYYEILKDTSEQYSVAFKGEKGGILLIEYDVIDDELNVYSLPGTNTALSVITYYVFNEFIYRIGVNGTNNGYMIRTLLYNTFNNPTNYASTAGKYKLGALFSVAASVPNGMQMGQTFRPIIIGNNLLYYIAPHNYSANSTNYYLYIIKIIGVVENPKSWNIKSYKIDLLTLTGINDTNFLQYYKTIQITQNTLKIHAILAKQYAAEITIRFNELINSEKVNKNHYHIQIRDLKPYQSNNKIYVNINNFETFTGISYANNNIEVNHLYNSIKSSNVGIVSKYKYPLLNRHTEDQLFDSNPTLYQFIRFDRFDNKYLKDYYSGLAYGTHSNDFVNSMIGDRFTNNDIIKLKELRIYGSTDTINKIIYKHNTTVYNTYYVSRLKDPRSMTVKSINTNDVTRAFDIEVESYTGNKLFNIDGTNVDYRMHSNMSVIKMIPIINQDYLNEIKEFKYHNINPNLLNSNKVIGYIEHNENDEFELISENPLLSDISGSCVITLDTCVYLIGGVSNSGSSVASTNKVFKGILNSEGEIISWDSYRNMPTATAASYSTYIQLDKYIYIISGSSSKNIYRAEILPNDELTEFIQYGANNSFPITLYSVHSNQNQILRVKNKLYTFGGGNGVHTSSINTIYHATINWDNEISTFTPYSKTIHAAAYAVYAFQLNDKIFYISNVNNNIYSCNIIDDEGNIDGNWQISGDLNFPTNADKILSIIQTNNKLMLIYSENVSKLLYIYYHDINNATESLYNWKLLKSDINYNIYISNIIVTKSKIYLAGGLDNTLTGANRTPKLYSINFEGWSYSDNDYIQGTYEELVEYPLQNIFAVNFAQFGENVNKYYIEADITVNNDLDLDLENNRQSYIEKTLKSEINYTDNAHNKIYNIGISFNENELISEISNSIHTTSRYPLFNIYAAHPTVEIMNTPAQYARFPIMSNQTKIEYKITNSAPRQVLTTTTNNVDEYIIGVKKIKEAADLFEFMILDIESIDSYTSKVKFKLKLNKGNSITTKLAIICHDEVFFQKDDENYKQLAYHINSNKIYRPIFDDNIYSFMIISKNGVLQTKHIYDLLFKIEHLEPSYNYNDIKDDR